MSRRKRGLNVHGVVLLDKPAGISSNRALQRVRGIFQARKAGHTGSLDPFATGMLVVCLGEASKTASFMMESAKSYRATALLGQATTTGDIEGEVIQSMDVPKLAPQDVDDMLQQFCGETRQVPPMYSALKHQGKPLYEYARAGIEIERKARSVTIHSIRLVAWQAPKLTFEVHCSKGTYIRTLAEDIARKLGSCAHLVELRRSSVEPFENMPMVSLEQLQEGREKGTMDEFLLPVDAGLADWPLVTLDENQRVRFSHGNPFSLSPCQAPTGRVRVSSAGGDILGIATLLEDGILKALKVFNL
jgi:tRNA pseudouridine55 synthase